MQRIQDLQHLSPRQFESPAILKKLTQASRKLAELKGIAASIPNQGILINTLGMQEAKDSSAIENIVTTHDELFRDETFPEASVNPAAKEVLRYRQALRTGFDRVKGDGLLTLNHILRIQAELEGNQAGFRKVPGTVLRDGSGRAVYTPPQDPQEILSLMEALERFINEPGAFDADPLIRMALIHHQFESIHPFYDGNGRTGRILNVLYLVQQGLLDGPILYLSRYIVRHKGEYYRLLQSVRDRNEWEEWVLYMLAAVESTAEGAIAAIEAMHAAFLAAKHRIRKEFKFYSQDLLNNLFTHPYTKIEFIVQDLKVTRLTASRYLEALVQGGILEKRKIGRTLYFINPPLYAILTGERRGGTSPWKG